MGDEMTGTPLDVLMYFLVFGGVPFFLIVVPLVFVPWVYRITKRSTPGRSNESSVADD